MSNGNDRKDVDELRVDIEHTRQRISGEIEAIGEKLTPDHAKAVARDKVIDVRDRAIESVRTGARNAVDAAEHATERLPRFVRENPVPVAMVIVGGSWLAFSALRRRRERVVEPQLTLPLAEPVGEGVGVMGTEHHEAAGRVRDRIGSMKSTARERLGFARERAGAIKDQARERLSGTAHAARERATDYAERGKHGAIRARDRSVDAFDQNPLAIGAVAMLAGLGAGLLLPHTRREDRLLGRPRERFVGRARHIVEEAKEAAIESAKEGLRAAKETAESEMHDRGLVR